MMFLKNPRLPCGILRSRPGGIQLGSPDSLKGKYLRVLCVSSAAGGKLKKQLAFPQEAYDDAALPMKTVFQGLKAARVNQFFQASLAIVALEVAKMVSPG